MDSQSVHSDISANSSVSSTYRPHYRPFAPAKPLTDCQRRARLITSIQYRDTMIEQYSKMEKLPKCPANIPLFKIASDEKKSLIEKKEKLVSELAVLPPCLDPDCPDHTVLNPKIPETAMDLATKPPQKRKGSKVDSEGFVFPKKSARPTTPTKDPEPVEINNNFDSLNNDDTQ
ncbi:hypothetical protein TNCT_427181 [Trichonephila clavata]|uniref:Uncharacterized protein n=1 Tax=Trichonephila clavata TaxID=2740835 RepID=A0A8X6I6M7_TRICU|nr:hypothetical protein TNCT_427181 [Trichonephila clavata]